MLPSRQPRAAAPPPRATSGSQPQPQTQTQKTGRPGGYTLPTALLSELTSAERAQVRRALTAVGYGKRQTVVDLLDAAAPSQRAEMIGSLIARSNAAQAQAWKREDRLGSPAELRARLEEVVRQLAAKKREVAAECARAVAPEKAALEREAARATRLEAEIAELRATRAPLRAATATADARAAPPSPQLTECEVRARIATAKEGLLEASARRSQREDELAAEARARVGTLEEVDAQLCKLLTNVGELDTVQRGERAVSELLQHRSLVGILRTIEAELEDKLAAVQRERGAAHVLLDSASLGALSRQCDAARAELRVARREEAAASGGVGGSLATHAELAAHVRRYAEGPPFLRHISGANGSGAEGVAAAAAQTIAARAQAKKTAQLLTRQEARAEQSRARVATLVTEFAALRPEAKAVPLRVEAERAALAAQATRLEAEDAAAAMERPQRLARAADAVRLAVVGVWRGKVESANRAHAAEAAELRRELEPAALSSAVGPARVRRKYRAEVESVVARTEATRKVNAALRQRSERAAQALHGLKVRRSAPAEALRRAVLCDDARAVEREVEARFEVQRYTRSCIVLAQCKREIAALERRAAQPSAAQRDAVMQHLERAFPQLPIDVLLDALASTGYDAEAARALLWRRAKRGAPQQTNPQSSAQRGGSYAEAKQAPAPLARSRLRQPRASARAAAPLLSAQVGRIVAGAGGVAYAPAGMANERIAAALARGRAARARRAETK